jgi:hypothetical protein
MRRRPLEETLLALRRARESPQAEESREELRRVLRGEGCHAVARAAAIVGELALEALVPDVVSAFPRFFEGLPRADPGCAAKTAIVEALLRLDAQDEMPFVASFLEKGDEAAEAATVDGRPELRAALSRVFGRGVRS